MVYDAIVVGGSYAGISAALQLARARRSILVIDGGERRNRFAAHSHGFLGQDGREPGQIAEEARAQLLNYPSVTWLSQRVETALKREGEFHLTTGEGGMFSARRLILATGVVDELPAIPGLAERWGQWVFHCPYCHGYELNRESVGVLASSGLAFHQAMMLPDWGPTTLFLNGVFAPDAAQRQQLQARGVTIVSEPVVALDGERADVTLADGRVVTLAGLFIQPRTRMASSLASMLDCTCADGPAGPYIQVDERRETSVAGVFACGDAAVAAGTVAVAVGDGARTGSAVHQSLIFR